VKVASRSVVKRYAYENDLQRPQDEEMRQSQHEWDHTALSWMASRAARAHCNMVPNPIPRI
jgi:hypothetical protein